MASLMSLFATGTAPTGQREMPDLTPSEFDRIVPRDGPAPLFKEVTTNGRAAIGQYAEVSAPLWENPTFLVIMALIAICLLVTLAFFIGKRQSQQCRNDYALFKREQEERTYMRSGLFDAASDITRVSAMYNLRNQRRRSMDVLASGLCSRRSHTHAKKDHFYRKKLLTSQQFSCVIRLLIKRFDLCCPVFSHGGIKT